MRDTLQTEDNMSVTDKLRIISVLLQTEDECYSTN